jgi:hypothetical protein
MMIFGELDGFTSGCSIRWPSFSMVSCYVSIAFPILTRKQELEFNYSEVFCYVSNFNFSAAGQVVIDTSLPFRSNNYSKILSVSPIAVPASKTAQFSVKGINLTRPATRYSLLVTLLIAITLHIES